MKNLRLRSEITDLHFLTKTQTVSLRPPSHLINLILETLTVQV